MLFTLNFLPLWLTHSWQCHSSLLGGNFHLDFFPTILQSFFIHKQRYALHEWSSTVINFFPTAQPIYLCPVDLHKLQHLCGFDIVDRYRQVLSWLLFLFISFECCLKCETVLTWSLINFRVLLIFLYVLLCYYTGVWRRVFPEVVVFFTIISSGPLSELAYEAHKERLKWDIPLSFDWVFCFVLKLLEFFKRHNMKEEAEWYQSRLEFIDNQC